MAKQAEGSADRKTGTTKKASLMALVKAVAFVSVVVLLEFAAASMLIPSSEDTEEIANSLAAAEVAEDGAAEVNAEDADDQAKRQAMANMREVPLGDYHVVTYDPDTESSLNVDFELIGTVLADEEGEFFSRYETNAARISEQVLIAVRGAEVSDLTDPTLGLIKRRILEKTNRALGRPLLHEVVFSKFSFVEH